jgi:hypothetical protein
LASFVACIGCVICVAEVAGSIHINSTVLPLFIFVFVFIFLIFIFSSFPLSSYHPIIRSSCHVWIFEYFIFYTLIPYFQKCSTHEQDAFRQQDVWWNRSGINRSSDILSWRSINRLWLAWCQLLTLLHVLHMLHVLQRLRVRFTST